MALDAEGSLVVLRPIHRTAQPGLGVSAVIEEDVRADIADVLRFAGQLLGRWDPIRVTCRSRAPCVLPAARLTIGGSLRVLSLATIWTAAQGANDRTAAAAASLEASLSVSSTQRSESRGRLLRRMGTARGPEDPLPAQRRSRAVPVEPRRDRHPERRDGMDALVW